MFEKILEQFKSSHELKPTFSYGVRRFEGSYQNTLRAVDTGMYRMKEEFRKVR